VVHDAFRAQVGRAVTAAALAALSLSGCFGGSDGRAPQNAGARIGVPVRLADCRDWRRAGPGERAGIVKGMRDFASGPTGTPGQNGPVIPDDKAQELFDSYCRNDFARSFKLYRLYSRAAAFRGGRWRK
jgi:hypothetical protein